MDAATNVSGKLGFDGYVLDRLNQRLTREGTPIALRPKAFEVLCRLVENAPNLVAKERLIESVWPDVVVGEDSLVQCVREIRLALRDDKQEVVRTVPRRGYVFTRPVGAASEPPAAPLARRRARWALAGVVLFAVVAIAVFVTFALVDRGAAGPVALRVGVQPVRALGNDNELAARAEAVTDDLTSDLSRLPRTRVGAPGATYMLRGTVRRLDDEVRLNLHLVDAASGEELWTARFDEHRDRLAGLQRRLAAQLAGTLHVRLFDAEWQRRLREHGGTPNADDLSLRGWSLWRQNRPDTVAQAREVLERAVTLDPRSPYAWAYLNYTYVSDLTNNWIDLRTGHTWAEWVQRADDAATRAYAIDPSLSATLGALSATRMLQRRTAEAIALRERQIEVDPGNAIARHNLAALKLHAGLPEQVLAQEQEAMRASPHDPKLHQMMGVIALALLQLGNDREALQWAERAVAVNPDYGGGHAYVAAAAARLNDLAHAKAALAELKRVLPKHRIQTFRDEFEGYSDEPRYRAGMEPLYDGLRRAGLAE
jgi:DNA-binding winged helix-turn-helix (wHTH) protein/TolB-like protein